MAVVTYWLLLWHDPAHFSMIDTRVYLAGARVLLHGGRLYALRATGAHLPFTYPPLAAVFFAWMPAVGLWWAKVASIAASQVALVVSTWLVVGRLGVRAGSRWGLAALASAGLLWLEPVQSTLQFGQVNLLVMALVLADLCRRPRRVPPGVFIGVAAGLKLVPAIFVVYLLLAGRVRPAVTAVATFAGTVAIGAVAAPGPSAVYWGGLAFDSSRVGAVAHVSDQSIAGLLARLAGGPDAAHSTWLVVAAVVGAVGVLTAASLHRGGNPVHAALVCGITGVLISPIAWNHHWVWAAPVSVFLAHGAWTRRSRWWTLGLAAWVSVFASGMIWRVPGARGRGYRWPLWAQLAGNAYVLAGLAFVAASGVWVALAAARPSGESGDYAPAALTTASVAKPASSPSSRP